MVGTLPGGQHKWHSDRGVKLGLPARFAWRLVLDLSGQPGQRRFLVWQGGNLSFMPAELTYGPAQGYIMSQELASLPHQHHVPPVSRRTCVVVISCYTPSCPYALAAACMDWAPHASQPAMRAALVPWGAHT